MSEIRVDAIKTRAGAVPTANDVGLNIIGTIGQFKRTVTQLIFIPLVLQHLLTSSSDLVSLQNFLNSLFAKN